MFYKGNVTYRVVVSHNPKHPEIYFIDICRDGFCSHDMIFMMQKKYYEDENLVRVFNDSRGIMLITTPEGEKFLRYTGHRDIMAQHHQALLRQKVDPQIMKTFDKMMEDGKIQTICVPFVEIDSDMQRVCQEKGYAESLQEEDALKALERKQRIEQLKKIRHKYYLNQKYADAPHLQLMLKQAERSGD